MKVFATVKNNGVIELIEWLSIKAFEQAESWCDPKFINTCTSVDMKIGSYEFPRVNKGVCIVLTADQLEGHRLMHEKRSEVVK